MKAVTSFIMARLVGLVVLILVLLGISAAAWFHSNQNKVQTMTVTRGSFTQQISVSGKVSAINDVRLGFLQGGLVKHLYVAVGDMVTPGEVLAETQNDDVRALLAQRRAALAAEEANLQALKDGVRPEEVAVQAAAVDNASVALAQSKQSFIETMQDAYRAADNAVRVQVDQFLSNPRTNPRLTFVTTDSQSQIFLETTRSELEGKLLTWNQVLDTIATADTGTQHDVFIQSQDTLSRIAEFLTAASSVISQAVVSPTATGVMLLGYASDISTARTSINTGSRALTSADTSLKGAEATLNTAQKQLALLKAGATATALAAEEAKVASAEALVDDAKAQLQKTFITAPFSGTVTTVDIARGEVAGTNVPVITVISESKLQIESYVPEINMALLSEGNSARVTLDAYGDKEEFPAEIVSIDPAETIRDGVSTYRTILLFIADDPRIRAGMTANVVVTTIQKDGVIAIPQNLVRSFNGKKLVNVLENDVVVEREVTTGLLSSAGSVEILSGLSEGDKIVLD